MTSKKWKGAAALWVASVVVASCGGGGADGEVGPIEAGLIRIPVDVLRDARSETDFVEIEIVDIARLSELRRLDEPKSGRDADDVTDGLVDLTNARGRRPEVDALLRPEVLQNIRQSDDVEAIDDQIGLDIGAITAYSSVIAFPVTFSVFVGDDSVSSSLVDVGDGVSSTYDGDDESFDRDQIGPADRLGRPVRVGLRDDSIALSLSTDSIEAWLDDERTAADDDDDLVDAARALDAAGTVSAYIIEGDFEFDVREIAGGTASPERVAEIEEALDGQVGVRHSYDVVGIGGTEIDGDVVMVVVYVFDDEDDADDAVGDLEDVWTDAESFANPGLQIDELVDLVSVEATGRTVTVIAEPEDRSPVLLGAQFLLRREVVFIHR